MNLESQTKTILKHLLSGRTITANQAKRLYGSARCAARIGEAKKMLPAGKVIETIMINVRDNKRVAKYSMRAE